LCSNSQISFVILARACWLRDLSKEGIEPNPGPSWDDFLDAVQQQYRTDFPNLKPALQNMRNDLFSKLKPPPLAVKIEHVKDYLMKDENQSVIQFLQLETYVKDFNTIIAKLEGTLNLCFDRANDCYFSELIICIS
jgi:hypothetical protein